MKRFEELGSFWVLFGALLLCIMPASVDAEPLKVRRSVAATPVANPQANGSGSGVILGARLVLTNRHVVENENHWPYGTFRVRMAPDYKTGHPAQVLWICDDFDLALLRTDDDLDPAGESTLMLDGLPPLGTKVTALGFPLGDQFGISITATGGQITRHPVDSRNEDDVRTSLWHDAVTAGGSSGGPLFTEGGVLVGLHFASLTAAKGNVLAVPSRAIFEFLEQTKIDAQVTKTSTEAFTAAHAEYKPTQRTVYVESVGTRSPPFEWAFDRELIGRLRTIVEPRIKEFLPRAETYEIEMIEAGDYRDAFQLTPAAAVKENGIARILGLTQLLQLLDDGVLVTMDGIPFKILLGATEAQKMATALSAERYPAHDNVFVVGTATNFVSARGATASVLTLTPLSRLLRPDSLAGLIKEKRDQRALAERDAAREAARVAQEDLRRDTEIAAAAEMAESKRRLRRTFKDSSGSFSMDAIAVALDGRAHTIELMSPDGTKRTTVGIDRLRSADRTWITTNAGLIRTRGPAVVNDLTKQDGQKK